MDVERVPKIFISYRRDDTSGFANLLYEMLSDHFGDDHVFRDIFDIGPGKIFKEAIKDEINSCDVLLAVIGKDWLTITKKKLANGEEDFVRMEISAALSRTPPIMVIPVMVEGAEVPLEQDLPDDLKGLVRPNASILGDRWLKQDVRQLIEELEDTFGVPSETGISPKASGKTPRNLDHPPPQVKARISNTQYSFFWGTLAGLISGTTVGIYYTISESVEWWRAILVGFYGLVAGALVSIFINWGIGKTSRLMNQRPLSKIIGSTLGGALGGVLAAVLGGVGFAWLSGNPVEPVLVATAVIASSFFIALGILSPELKEGWAKAVSISIVLFVVAAAMWFLARWILNEKLSFVSELLRASSSPTNLGVLILGAVCGVISGLQVGTGLLCCDWYDKSRGSESIGKSPGPRVPYRHGPS